MARIASRSSSNAGLTSAAASPPGQPGDGALRALVERLTSLEAGDHWVVSCYLKLEPRDRSRGKYQIKLKNRIRSQLAGAERALEHAERQIVSRDLDRIREYLDDPAHLPAGRGIALFACEPIGLFAALPLPQVLRSRLVIDRTPLVRELAALEDEFGLMYGAVYDRTSARLFRVTAFEIEELPGIAAADSSRTAKFHAKSVAAGPGRGQAAAGEHNHHQRIREEKHRHYALVAQRLFELTRNGAVRGVALAGIGVEADAVLPYLHPYVRDLVLGSARLNPKVTTSAEIHAALLEVRRKAEREEEHRLVAELEEKRGAGWAVSGIEPTLLALSQGQVRTLLVNPAAEVPGFRCGSTRRLTADTAGCDGEGPASPVEDLIDEALEEALAQRSQVDVIEAPELKGRIDGLAALLRFKMG